MTVRMLKEHRYTPACENCEHLDVGANAEIPFEPATWVCTKVPEGSTPDVVDDVYRDDTTCLSFKMGRTEYYERGM